VAKVLVVDDEPGYRKALQEVISAEGHSVEIAANSQDAFEIAERSCPDVLIVDWMLENALCGLEVSESLRKLNHRLTTIIITGYLGNELRARAEESNIFAFLEKPFELDDIRKLVRRATENETGGE